MTSKIRLTKVQVRDHLKEAKRQQERWDTPTMYIQLMNDWLTMYATLQTLTSLGTVREHANHGIGCPYSEAITLITDADNVD